MKAMILAAGRGARMGAISEKISKALLPVAGKPLLHHHLERLARVGVKEVMINLCYKKDQILAALEHADHFGLKLHFSIEDECLDTGGGLLKALPFFEQQDFIYVNADIYTDYPLEQLIAHQLQAAAHMVLVPNPSYRSHGDCRIDDDLLAFDPTGPYTYTGMAKLSPQLFVDCEPGAFSIIEPLRRFSMQHQVSAEIYNGLWHDIGTPERLAALKLILET